MVEIVLSRPCSFGRQKGIICVAKNALLWRPEGENKDTFILQYRDLSGLNDFISFVLLSSLMHFSYPC
jgi:hypothetical protein